MQKVIGVITRSDMTPEREIKIRRLIEENKGATLLLTCMSNMEVRTAEIAFELLMNYNVIIPSTESIKRFPRHADRALVLAHEWHAHFEGYYSYKRLVETAKQIVKKCDILVISGKGELIDAIISTAQREKVKIYDIT